MKDICISVVSHKHGCPEKAGGQTEPHIRGSHQTQPHEGQCGPGTKNAYQANGIKMFSEFLFHLHSPASLICSLPILSANIMPKINYIIFKYLT